MNSLHQVPELRKVKVDNDLLLRPLQNDDAAAILAILERDPSIRQRVSVAEVLFEPQDVVQAVDTYRGNPSLIRYVIVQHAIVIGLISFWRHDEGDWGDPIPNTYGFGYFLDPNSRGKGTMGKVVMALMDTAEQVLNPAGFVAFCEDDNDPSRAILQKLGFSKVNKTFPAPNNDTWIEHKYLKMVK